MYKLLLVDDEALIRKGIKTLIDFTKLEISAVLEAANGLEGLSVFEKYQPELVILDINLPHMNGLELASKIKKINPYTKIAMLTGYDYFDYAVTALKIGVDDYILKPVSKQDVTDAIIRLIHSYNQLKVQQEISSVVKNISKENASTYPVDSIQETLDSQLYNSDLSLTSFAEKLGYSTSYLSGMLKSILGMPFQEYVLSSRLEKAKLLLLTTPLKNYEIAEKVGFQDVNYFNTRFKQKYGLSPKQYLKAVRNPNENDEMV
ncbi:response regulator [Fusibacter bizertensis]|uniref:Stage 0 sporulation protein A homolog n=1 Tax=Fusibacter bizertensis TaxID=1488331 RepID=A0ABT6NBR6_9FIRM|nr:response regulator [Fusibacter bizertensis]MDH8677844.1 response regulator [Fusibacter bizertensis]